MREVIVHISSKGDVQDVEGLPQQHMDQVAEVQQPNDTHSKAYTEPGSSMEQLGPVAAVLALPVAMIGIAKYIERQTKRTQHENHPPHIPVRQQ